MKRLGDDEDHTADDEDQDQYECHRARCDGRHVESPRNQRLLRPSFPGKTVLPRSMPQIHYRSKYRELIRISNAALLLETI